MKISIVSVFDFLVDKKTKANIQNEYFTRRKAKTKRKVEKLQRKTFKDTKNLNLSTPATPTQM